MRRSFSQPPAGYEFMGDSVLQVDKINHQVGGLPGLNVI